MFFFQIVLGFFVMLGIATITSPLWLFWLANNPRLAHLSPFTTLEDGEAKAIVKGKTFSGAVAKMEGFDLVTDHNIHFYQGSELWDIVEKNSQAPDTKSLWQKYLGLYKVGIPPFKSLHRYIFEWTTPKDTSESGKSVSVHRKEQLTHIYIKDANYLGVVSEAETSDQLPINAKFVLVLRVVNVYKALFKVDRFLDSIMNQVRQQGRNYIGTRTYKQLIQEEGDETKEGFSHGVRLLKDEIRKRWGVEIVKADFVEISLAGTAAAKYEEASTALYLAEAKKTATVTTAEGEAKAIELVGEARKKALVSQAEAYKGSEQAAQAILDAEVGRAMGIKPVTEAIAAGIRAGFSGNQPRPEQQPTPPTGGQGGTT